MCVEERQIEQIGPFRVRRFIREDRAAWVFEVRDERGATRALRLLRPQAVAPESFERLTSDARAGAFLEQPNLITFYESGRDDATGSYYYTTTLFEGSPLPDRGDLAAAEIGRIFLDVLSGLAGLHEAGLVYGELRASNVLVSGDGRATLADVVTGRIGAGVEGEATEAAVANRRSPEQRAGAAGDARSDVFCAGLCLYEALTGRSAAGDEPSVASEMPFPSRVPVALREIVERACSVDPEQRYPSAVEMRDALALAIGQGSAKTDARRWPAALLAALAVAVTGVAAVVGVPELRERLGPARETESEVTPTPSQAAAAPAPPTQVASPAPQRAESEAAPVKASIPANVDFGSYHALVVGNNAYEALPRLNTAVDDALAVAALLRDAYDFDVTMLTNATRGEIIGSLAAYRARLTRDDNLLIYYAGHGWYDDDAGRGYWLPVGATKADPSNWVSNTDVSDMLRAMEVGQAIVVADSCYSGSLTRAASMIFSRTYYQRMREERTRVVLTSGGLGPVADGSGGDHSVFAKALLDALRENQGVLEGQSLFAAIRRPVMLGAAQVPQYGDIRFAGHEGGDFLFVRRH